MKVFITGTDTNVGKTFISSILCNKYNLNYLKPIQTGLVNTQDDDRLFIEKNIQNSDKNIAVYDNIYKFQNPLSPLACSIIENQIIDKNFLFSKTEEIIKANKNLLIEGAGGVFVPIMDNFFMIDFIQHINLPVIIVAEDKLGCINHTFLTVNSLISRGIMIEKIILNRTKSTEDWSNYAILKKTIPQIEVEPFY